MSARPSFASFALALAIAACAKPAEQAAAPPAVDSAAVQAAVADLWQRWIVADTAGNVAALVEMVGDSARLDLQGMPAMVGRAAWKQMVEAGYKTTKYTSMTITPDMTVPVSNELAYQNGNFTEGATTGGKQTMNYGRYASALRKDADGQWRIAYIMVLSDSIVPVKK
jgi:ketosteroid isomerase-like protein